MFNLKSRLARTRDSLIAPLQRVFQRGGALSAEDEETIEELLLGADLGVDASEAIMDALRRAGDGDYREYLRDELLRLLAGDAPPATSGVSTPRPRAVVVVGVNGVGKTTSIAKLTHLLRQQGESVLLAACDTFRAAAADQLSVWADRLKVDLVRHGDGGDPAAVAYDACNAAQARDVDTVVLDTAGRLHTKVNLMEELAKIRRVCAKVLGDDAVQTYLALDATLGQNSLIQAQEFTRRLDTDGIILTKLDSTARGGIVVAIRQSLGIPVRYIGVGEQLDDFGEFSAEAFVDALLA